jgi:hypothetical protein
VKSDLLLVVGWIRGCDCMQWVQQCMERRPIAAAGAAASCGPDCTHAYPPPSDPPSPPPPPQVARILLTGYSVKLR